MYPIFTPLVSFVGSKYPSSILLQITRAVSMNAPSTLAEVIALVSTNKRPFSLANRNPSSSLTCLCAEAPSALFPTRVIVAYSFAWRRQSSNQEFNCQTFLFGKRRRRQAPRHLGNTTALSIETILGQPIRIVCKFRGGL